MTGSDRPGVMAESRSAQVAVSPTPSDSPGITPTLRKHSAELEATGERYGPEHLIQNGIEQ